MSPRRGPKRWARRLSAAVFMVLALTVGISAPAWAWCEGDAPAPKAPDSGLAGFFVSDPNLDIDWSEPPAVPDPFDESDPAGLVDTYGYPYHWGTYDLGCGPDAARDPGAIAFTSMANFVFDLGLAAGAIAESVESAVHNGPLEFLSEPLDLTQAAVMDQIWTVWFPVALMFLGVIVVGKARRAEMSENTTIVGLVVLVIAGSVYFLSVPTQAADRADELIGGISETASSPFGAESSIDEQIAREVYYPMWLEGSFGSSDSEVAKAYGPDLFKSMHYSWLEWQWINEVGLVGKKIVDENKSDQFKEIASELKENYPGEYRYLIGKESTDRMGYAVMSTVYASAVAFMAIVGLLMILLAMLMIRAFIVAFPIAGMLGIYPQGRATLLKLWQFLSAALFNVVKFAFATGLYMVITTAVFDSGLSDAMKLAVIIVTAVAVLLMTRPIRAIKSMIPGANPNHSYLRGSFDRWRHRRNTRKGVRQGLEDSDSDEQDSDEKVQADPVGDPGRDREDEDLPPMPAPTLAVGYSRVYGQPKSVGPGVGENDGAYSRPAGRPVVGELPTGAAPDDDGYGASGEVVLAPHYVPSTSTSADAPGGYRGRHTPFRALPLGNSAPENGTADHVGNAPVDRELATSSPAASSPSSSRGDGGIVAASPRSVSGAVLDGDVLEPIYRRVPESRDQPSQADLDAALAEPVVAEPVIDTETGEEVFMIYSRPGGDQ